MSSLTDWLQNYRDRQQELYAQLPLDEIGGLIRLVGQTRDRDGQIFVFGNGGSAANASHFATDLGKGSSDATKGARFRVLTLNDNVAWMTALGNDYSYEEVFTRQLQNYARPGDLALVLSVSGNSPNLVHAIRWARAKGLATVALVGEKRGALAEIAEHVIVLPDGHYGRVEDAQMTICHMLAYAFMEAEGAVGGQA